jgi:hypothetical protein
MKFTKKEMEIIKSALESQFYENTGFICACNYYDICNNCNRCKEDLVSNYLNDNNLYLEEGIDYIN